MKVLIIEDEYSLADAPKDSYVFKNINYDFEEGKMVIWIKIQKMRFYRYLNIFLKMKINVSLLLHTLKMFVIM